MLNFCYLLGFRKPKQNHLVVLDLYQSTNFSNTNKNEFKFNQKKKNHFAHTTKGHLHLTILVLNACNAEGK